MEWQPIATAPKDGTEILGSSTYGDFSVAAWWDGGWVGMCEGSKSIESQGDFETYYHRPYLTQWMPLPPAPTDGGSDA